MLDKFSHTDSYILIGATLCAQKISKIDPPSPWTFSSKIESPGFDRIVWRHHNFKMCLTLETIYYLRRDHPRSRQQWLIGLPFWDDDFDLLILSVIRWSKMMRLCVTICSVPGNPYSHAHGSLCSTLCGVNYYCVTSHKTKYPSLWGQLNWDNDKLAWALTIFWSTIPTRIQICSICIHWQTDQAGQNDRPRMVA